MGEAVKLEPVKKQGTSGEKFLSPEPEVRLTKAFPKAFRNAVAAAQTCCSSKGIVDDDGVTPRYADLAREIYQAGHHTVFQHAHFQFALSGISRHFIWSFLHAHPFYNSEQVSQRYVEVKAGSAVIPPLAGPALQRYMETVSYQTEAYRQMTDLLVPVVDAEFAKRFPRRRKGFEKDVRKKAMELARYVLPVATTACLYHTVSGITLLRYHRLCISYDAPLEQRIVVEKMAAAVLAVEPDYIQVLQEPLTLEETPEYQFFSSRPEWAGAETRRAFLREFDDSLDGWTSKLVDIKSGNEAVLARAVREVLGVPRAALSNEEAIRLALDPSLNRLQGETLNLSSVSKLSRTLVHPAYTFRKKISLTADSQDQRHRMTPASRPVLAAHLTADPDVVTPDLIRADDQTARLYDETMAVTWESINALRREGVPDEFVLYLLPNATAVRYAESADLMGLRHKHAMRLCWNAQEEIWRATLDEALQVREANPLIGKYLLPPCALREMAGARPICPEGARYCGVKVWKLGLHEYERRI
jgi:flavin-dependent thymidylate synthase